VVAKNRRARFDYTIEETYEVGLELVGSEVKSLREGNANLSDSLAGEKPALLCQPEYRGLPACLAVGAHVSAQRGCSCTGENWTRLTQVSERGYR
jgi:hypothetical protein